MPALLAPIVGFAVGALLAWVASAELSRSPSPLLGSRALAVVVLFSFLVYGPYAGYFVTYAPDWSFAYLFDARHVPSALLLVLVLFDIASVPIGFVAAVPRLRRGARALVPLAAVPVVVALVLVLAWSRRLSTVGTFGQVSRGFGTVPLGGSPVGHAVLWFSACFAAALAWTARELRLPSREPPKPPPSRAGTLGRRG